MPDTDRYITVTEAARALGVRDDSILDRIKRGKLKAVQPAGKWSTWLVDPDSLEDYRLYREAKARKRRATTDPTGGCVEQGQPEPTIRRPTGSLMPLPPEPTPAECRALIAAARQAAGRTFRLERIGGGIGAAVLTVSGRLYAAGTYYTDVRTLTIHAELGALIHAAAHAEYRLRAVAAVRLGEDRTATLVPPCGLCRQVLNESSAYAGLPLLVLLAGDGPAGYRLCPLDDLLPEPYPQWTWRLAGAAPRRPPEAEPPPDPTHPAAPWPGVAPVPDAAGSMVASGMDPTIDRSVG